jgi:hypothetical protein
MNDQQHQFLALLAQPPARLTAEQTSWVLNCRTYDIPVLVAARLLKPLGSPIANGTKFFCTVEILELARDPAWMARMTNAIYGRWRRNNANKRNHDHKPFRESVDAAMLRGPGKPSRRVGSQSFPMTSVNP